MLCTAYKSSRGRDCAKGVIMKRSKLTVFLLPVLCAVVYAKEYKPKVPPRCLYPSEEWSQKVYYIQKKVRENVYDYDKDNDINCKDHAVLFKIWWDKTYSDEKINCQIVRNYNKHTGFNHLFVKVWDRKLFRYIYVETQNYDGVYDHAHVCMNCMWGKLFDAYYNYNGETDYWLAGHQWIRTDTFE